VGNQQPCFRIRRRTLLRHLCSPAHQSELYRSRHTPNCDVFPDVGYCCIHRGLLHEKKVPYNLTSDGCGLRDARRIAFGDSFLGISASADQSRRPAGNYRACTTSEGSEKAGGARVSRAHIEAPKERQKLPNALRLRHSPYPALQPQPSRSHAPLSSLRDFSLGSRDSRPTGYTLPPDNQRIVPFSNLLNPTA